jgi:hypothetical protein
MTALRFVVTAALVAAASPLFAQSNVTGDWEATIQSMQGTNSVHITFKQDGDKLSGVLKSPMGELPFDGGSMVGNDLKFGFTVPVQGQALEITLTGTVDGSSMAGKAQFGGLGEGEWAAKRVEASSAAPPAASAGAAPSTTPSTSPSSSATGVNGTWDLTVKTDMGEVLAAAELSESGGKITGTFTGPTGAIDVNGTFEGNALKLAFVAKTPQGDIPVSMTGELSGDAIVNGKAEFGGMGQGEWSAKRRQ